MAIRYSGRVKIAVTLQDNDSFHATISEYEVDLDSRMRAVKLGTCSGLRLAPAWNRSIDCPEAYDEMARAALSFFSAGYGDGEENRGREVEINADFDDSGYVVTRKRPAWVTRK